MALHFHFGEEEIVQTLSAINSKTDVVNTVNIKVKELILFSVRCIDA